VRARISPKMARVITGTDLAAGAQGVYTPFDGLVGAPLRNNDADHAHLVGLRIGATLVLDTTNTITSAPPGAMAKAAIQNIRIRAGGVELIEPGVDGEAISLLQTAIHGFDPPPDPLEIPDATTADVAEPIRIDIRFDDLTGAFGRENDHGIPLAAFSTARDKEHGLRFDFLAAAALVKALTGVQMDTAGVVTSAYVLALVRYSRKLNLKAPTRARVYSESGANFSIDLKGGGGLRALFVADAPAAGTGIRSHTGYANVSLDFEGEQEYGGRTYIELADMFNFARQSPAQRLLEVDPTASTAVVTGPAGAAAAIRRPGIITPGTASEIMPLWLAPPGVSVKDLPGGRINVQIGTRTTAAEILHYAWDPDPDAAYAENVWAAAGMRGPVPKLVAHGAAGHVGRLSSAKRLPLQGITK